MLMIWAGLFLPVLALMSIAAIVFFLYLPTMFGDEGLRICFWCWLLLMAAVLLIFAATRFATRTLVTNGRGHLQLDALTLLDKDKRSPILYLRSFDDDGVPDLSGHKVQLGATLTVEISLAKALSRIGPLVSIGRPGEKLPALGTHRFYVDDDHWKQAVEHFLDISQAIVIVVGTSPGVEWEIEQAMARREKVIFILPFTVPETRRGWWQMAWEALRSGKQDSLSRGLLIDMERDRHARYARFRSMIEEKYGIELPHDLRGSIAIDFIDPDEPRLLSTVQPVALPRARDEQGVTVDYARTLRPFSDRIQQRMTKPDAMQRAYANTRLLSIIAWLSAGVAVLAFFSLPYILTTGKPPGLIAVALLLVLLASNVAWIAYMLLRRNHAKQRRERA
jgi:hypothetical protein